MKRKIALFVFLLSLSVAAQAHALSIRTPATHAILIDVNTGTVLLNKKDNEHMPTSSMSKTMTLYVVFEALKQGYIKLGDKFHVSKKAWKMGGSRMFLDVGSSVTVEKLIQGVAVQSGNDATIVLAEGLAGTEEAFVDRMNLTAKELGMNNTHFMNASGWPHENHYSTARDLAILAQRTIEDFPEYYHYYGEKVFTYNKIKQPNRNLLLGRVEGADGVKTGHAEAAGYGMIASAIRNGRRLIAVVNGLKSIKQRAQESARLIEWGFRSFKNKKLYKSGDVVTNAKLWLGEKDEVPLVVKKDIDIVLPVFKQKDLKIKLVYNSPIKAPVEKGDSLAKLIIDVPEQAPIEVKLFAGANVKRKGLFSRAFPRFVYFIENMD